VDANNNTQHKPSEYCNYTLPLGPYIANQTLIGNGFPAQTPVMIMVNSTLQQYEQPIRKGYFNNGLFAHVSSFSILNATWGYVQPDGDQPGYYNLSDAQATECGLDVCVKKYRASVTNSTFKEELLGTFINTTDFGYNHQSNDDLWIHPPQSWTNMTEDKGSNLFFLDAYTRLGLIDGFTMALSGGSIATVPFWQGAITNTFTGEIDESSDLMSYMRSLDTAGVSKMMDKFVPPFHFLAVRCLQFIVLRQA
jgi:hypothetical protein